jgi:hypothetical protein
MKFPLTGKLRLCELLSTHASDRSTRQNLEKRLRLTAAQLAKDISRMSVKRTNEINQKASKYWISHRLSLSWRFRC